MQGTLAAAVAPRGMPAVPEVATEDRQHSASVLRTTRNAHAVLHDSIKSFVFSALDMVEAAGVEPASERPVVAGVYMRSQTYKFATVIEARRT